MALAATPLLSCEMSKITLTQDSMEDLSSCNEQLNPTSYTTIQNSGRHRVRVLDFHSGRKCPTCGGTGKIPKGQDDQLVALIPYTDKRLKPRRTWIYCIFVVLCLFLTLLLISGSILAVFMYPRNVSITIYNSTQIDDFVVFKPLYVSATSHSGNNLTDKIDNITLALETAISISNSNFFPISLSQLNLTINYLESIVCNYSKLEIDLIKVRSSYQLLISHNVTFKSPIAKRIFSLCTAETYKVLNIAIEVSVAYVYLTHLTDDTATAQTLLNCFISFPLHNFTNTSSLPT